MDLKKAHALKMARPFHITSVTRNDVADVLCEVPDSSGNKRTYEQAEELAREISDDDMRRIASRMADDYVEHLYWDQLRVIVEDY